MSETINYKNDALLELQKGAANAKTQQQKDASDAAFVNLLCNPVSVARRR